MALLQIKNLSVDFVTGAGIVAAVKKISLEVDRGEVVAIVGESGSGKSVTALSVLQLLPERSVRYQSGEILFSPGKDNAIDLLKQSPKGMQQIRGNQIAMIFQEPMTSLNPVLTCGSQVIETIRRHKKLGATEARERAIELFESVKLPDPSNILHRYPHQLSGGQKQRVMIAIAMSCHPSLLICDEPTTALDVTVQKTILELIRELQQTENMGVIFITHDLGVVAEIADRVLVLYKGNVVEERNVTDLFADPWNPYTKGLLLCRPALHQKGERLPVVSDFMNLGERNEPGHKSEPASVLKIAEANEQIASRGKPLIRVEHLRVWYPSAKSFLGKTTRHLKAVDDISFEVYEGETLGLVGESGCGKTTLGRSLLRLNEPNSGKIIFKGLDILSCSKKDLKALRKEIQIVFQDPYASLNPRLMIGSAIKEPMVVHHLLEPAWKMDDAVGDLLKKVNLMENYSNRYPHEFSGGQRQRIVIARALAMNPTFMVFDEPVSALDLSVQAQVLNLINDLKKDFGFTAVFISHDLSVVRYISDRILVMNQGKIEEIGPAESVYHQPEKEYTRRLISSIPKGKFHGK